MNNFTKLSSAIITSTIWQEDNPTRIVWVTMLATADACGRVEGSTPGLSHIARVTVEECERALDRLMSPDPYSRTKEHEGRRVEEIDGGWRILNYGKYRERRDPEKRREQNREAKRRQRAKGAVSKKSANVSRDQPRSAQAEEEEEEEKYTPPTPPAASRPGGRKSFVPPTAKEVNAYAAELGYNNFSEPNKGAEFVGYYEERGWQDSHGRPVRNWKAKLRSVWLSKMKKPERGDFYWLPTEEQVDEIYSRCAEVSA